MCVGEKIMLKTPLGQIKISVNNKEVDCFAAKYNCDIKPIKDNPIAGCYRLLVACEKNDMIKCELIPSTTVEINDSGSETCAFKLFTKNNIQVAIGSFDVVNNCVCDFIENGLVFENLQGNETDKIVFGVAWVTDLQENDYRAWYAADPSLDK